MEYKIIDNYLNNRKSSNYIIKIHNFNEFKKINNNGKKIIILWILTFNNTTYPIVITEYSGKNKCKTTYLHDYNHIIDDTWISASRTRNYMLNDQLIDYLEYNKSNKKRKYNNNLNDDSFLTTLLNNGIEFEKTIMEKLQIKFKNDIITVGNYTNCRNPIYFKLTIDLIKNKVPIIYQGILHNVENKTFGMPDLIVRGDYVNKIINTQIDNINEAAYYIIDIKNSQLHLSAKNDNILNNINVKPYKGQIGIYHKILSQIQGFDTGIAFILGNRWTREIKNVIYHSDDPFDRLGIIDYCGNDINYMTLIDNSLEWYKEIRENKKLDYNNPNHKYLYPNMCIDSEPKYKKIKTELAEKNSEITALWMCGIKHRENAFKHKIYKWTDRKLNSKILGINGSNGKIVDLILKINQSKSITIYPNKIKYNLNNWQDRNCLGFYIDFETLNHLNNEIIFMIGVGHSINNNWEYKCLLINNLTDIEQCRIINEMINYIKDVSKLNNVDYQNVNIYHWSHFEPTVLSKACNKFNLIYPILKWTDILDIFHKEPIIIKGALNFSLKTIGKAMYNLKLITTIWPDNNKIMDGLSAMHSACNIYKTSNDVDNDSKMKDIIIYNHIDCKIMWDILNAL